MLSAYCWPHSGTPGSAIPLCATSSLGPVHVTVSRVGETRDVVARLERLTADDHRVPDDAVRAGSGWPATTEIATDASWPSGFYEVALEPVSGWPRGRAPRNGSNLAFFLHPAPGSVGRVLLVLGTNTWLAYNDFGGSNLYAGSTHVSWDRPMAPGLLAKPPGAGRRVAVVNPPDERMATQSAISRSNTARSGPARRAGRTTRRRSSRGPLRMRRLCFHSRRRSAGADGWRRLSGGLRDPRDVAGRALRSAHLRATGA
ncbi:MAG: hypothetical protein M3Q30_04595 [Actinomycetota bacterium]|nr:hypothetical protein [Actinomycetota bacterium]